MAEYNSGTYYSTEQFW